MMVAPGALVLFTPFFTGLFFSKDALSGLIAGIIVSGIQIAFSASNTGGAWDNCKKLVEEGTYESKSTKYASGEDNIMAPFVFRKKDANGKSTYEHQSAVIGDTVGDPLKDTSGPSINILMKLSAITSLVFGTFIAEKGGLIISSAK
jgi:inorganic pyrophosphatase